MNISLPASARKPRALRARRRGTSPMAIVALADGIAGARDTMGNRTLVVVGTVSPAGQPGFVILTDQFDPATGDFAAGEELQDHAGCPAPPPT